jgi:alpha-1,2-mannosyltransferase
VNALPAKLRALVIDADWLTADRALAFRRLLLAFTLVGGLIWIGTAKSGIDLAGKPLGTDFVSFWTASQLALSGRAAEAYDIAAHWAAQKALFGGSVAYTAFFYPPPYLLICLPLATLPYFLALALWLSSTCLAFAKVVRAYGGARADWLTILAFPAVLLNAGHGQNGFLSAALIGGGALWLDKRPRLAGLCFGAMAFKPQLALMIPVALIAARRWTTLVFGAFAATLMGLASLALWRFEPWRGFFQDAPLARMALERNWVGNEKMQSAFAAARLWHAGLGLAYGLQVAVALGVVAALIVLHRRAFRSAAEGPAIAAAALLGTPFLLDYDLTLLAIPLAWLFRRSATMGFLPGEKVALALAYLLPLIARPLAGAIGLPLSPILCLAVFGYVIARGVGGASSAVSERARDSLWSARPSLLLAAKG